MTRRLLPWCLLALPLPSASPAVGQAPPRPPKPDPRIAFPGFPADQSFHLGDVDNVNLFNGSLALALPIGGSYPINGGFSCGVKLSNSANDGDWIDAGYVDSEDPNRTIQTTSTVPGSCNNAGFGYPGFPALSIPAPALCSETIPWHGAYC